VHDEAGVALVSTDGLSGVKAHANAKGALGEALLSFGCGRDGVRCSGEGDEEGVTLRIDLDTAVLCEHLT
jgi:hypothetical protein